MEEYPVPILKNAPITEALIDIRTKLPSAIDVKSIDNLFEKIKNQYPEKQEQRVSEFSFELKADEEPVKASKHKVNGYRYISSGKKQIVQARLDGFTFSRLHPYIKWEDLRDEGHRLWDLYKEITSPEAITRVALRYINNLNIPMPITDFGDYLTAPPIVPEGISQSVKSFLTRVIIYEPSIDVNAIITHVLEPLSPEADRAPIILDIDVFKLRQDGIEEQDAWQIIEQLRHFKNKIFDKSITDKLKEIYQ